MSDCFAIRRGRVGGAGHRRTGVQVSDRGHLCYARKHATTVGGRSLKIDDNVTFFKANVFFQVLRPCISTYLLLLHMCPPRLPLPPKPLRRQILILVNFLLCTFLFFFEFLFVQNVSNLSLKMKKKNYILNTFCFFFVFF